MPPNGSGQAHPAPRSPERRGGLPRRVLRTLGWGPAQVTSPVARWAINILALAGAVLIIWSALIHLDLWAQGYRSISVIGPLFLAQGVASTVFAVALGVFRRLGLIVAGAALMAGTLGALILSVEIGLFGFKDSLAAPYAGMSLVVEIAGAVVLLAAAGLVAARKRSS
jgi:uncharacterized membrane protein YeaQ/YmgE (transglycosylase-associated protein family)